MRSACTVASERLVFFLNWIFQYFVLKPLFYWILHHFVLKNCVLLKFNHFLFKNAFGMHCSFRKTSFFSKLDFFQYLVFKPVFHWVLTPFFAKNCVLLKFNHFLFKNAFGIHCRLRKTFFVLNWIFQYFVLKTTVLQGLTQFCV